MQHQSFRQQTKRAGKSTVELKAAGIAGRLAEEFPVLARYLGETRARTLAIDFLSPKDLSRPFSRTWLKKFPADLARARQFKTHPEIAELALLELSFKQAFLADDAPVVVAPSSEAVLFGRRKFRLHPSVQCLVFYENTTSIWSALKCDEAPPRPFRLDQPQHVLVWRQEGLARFRILGEDEAKALARFKTRASDTSPYFRRWVEASLVVEPAK